MRISTSISSLCLVVIVFACWARPLSASVLLSAQPSHKDIYEAAWHFSDSSVADPGARLAIAPHHLLAAEYTARAYRRLSDDCRHVLVISPDHYSGRATFSSSVSDWQTPYGLLAFDDKAHQALSAKLTIRELGLVLGREHGLSSQAAFVKKRWPQAAWWPLAVKPVLDKEQQARLDTFLSEFLSMEGACAVLSSDFSHNVTERQAEEENRESLSAIRRQDPSSAHNDCPAGLQSFLRYGQKSGLSFRLAALSHSRRLAPRQKDGQVTSYLAGVFADTLNYPLRLLFFGDLMLDRGVRQRIDSLGIRWLFAELEKSAVLPGSYDLISANLEGAVTSGGKHYPPLNKYDFAMRLEDVSVTMDYGFSHFSMANNHSGDQGKKGWQETKKYLDNQGFDYSGCGNLGLGDCSSRELIIGSQKVALLSASQVYGYLDQQKLVALVSELRKKNDWLIIYLHWGQEYANRADARQKKLAYALIDAGADMIIGHHPHVVQGIETYQGRPIFYSLGNFIFDQGWSTATREELALDLSLGADGVKARLIPLWSERFRPIVLSGAQKEDFFRRLRNYSGPYQSIAENLSWPKNNR